MGRIADEISEVVNNPVSIRRCGVCDILERLSEDDRDAVNGALRTRSVPLETLAATLIRSGHQTSSTTLRRHINRCTTQGSNT